MGTVRNVNPEGESQMLQVLPVVAYVCCVGLILAVAIGNRSDGPMAWLLPAVAGLAFILFSVVTVAEEGAVQFWTNHTTSLAGNQVWFDLLSAVTISFYLIAPRARAVGMPLLPWGIAVFSTASIALLPMLARLIWLEQMKAKEERLAKA